MKASLVLMGQLGIMIGLLAVTICVAYISANTAVQFSAVVIWLVGAVLIVAALSNARREEARSPQQPRT